MVAVVADQPPPHMNRVRGDHATRRLRSRQCRDGRSPAVSGHGRSVARRLRRRGGDRGGSWRAATLLSRSRRIPGCGAGPLARQDSRRARQSGRHHDRRDGGRPDRSLRERTTARSRRSSICRPRRTPGEWQLTADCPPAGGRLPSLAQRDAVRAPSRGSVPFGPASRVDRPPVHQGLQRGQGGRWPRQHRASAGSGERGAALRRGGRRDSLEPDCQAARRRAPPLAVGECADVRAAQHGLERRRRRRDGHEVSLQLLAAGDRDCRRRHRWQRPNRPGHVVRALHSGAVFPQLPLGTREHELRRSRSARAHLRPAGTCHQSCRRQPYRTSS